MPEPSAWRVDNAKWITTSFNGLGASLEGGRWISAGIPVVYASQHLAMAAQEKYVHLPKPISRSSVFVKFRIGFGKLAVKRLEILDMPHDWRVEPVPRSTQRLGDAWVASGEAAILAVPSVLIPEEINFVLNPAHPDYHLIEISKHEDFTFDARLTRLNEPR
jgi:RES domain-containing protein